MTTGAEADIQRVIGCLTAQVEQLQKSVEANTAKIEELMAAKNKGLGILLAMGMVASVVGAAIAKAIDTAQVEQLQKSVEANTAKIKELMAAKNKGLGDPGGHGHGSQCGRRGHRQGHRLF